MKGDAAYSGDSARRERRRAEIIATVPSTYRHVPHLLIPSAIVFGLMAISIFELHALRAVELAAIPCTLFFAFAFEWWAHKYALHQRAPLAGELYERHELKHHVVFQVDDMAMRTKHEMWLILMPAWAVVIVFFFDIPLAVGTGLLCGRNVGWLVLATTMFFFLSYEWLHLGYHLPPDSFVGRLRIIRILREVHRRHHDPHLMKRWNFNVTLPVFDALVGTLWSPEREARADAKRPRALVG
jgi:hypothetical protein